MKKIVKKGNTMKRDELIKEVTKLVCSVTKNEMEIGLSDNLKEIGIDSLKMVELFVKIEDYFEIRFNDSLLNVQGIQTVGDVMSLIEKNL